MIRIVDSLKGKTTCCNEASIAEVLQNRQELKHQSTFTGRPTTQVYANQEFVAKLKVEFVFQEKDAEKRAQIAIDSERSINIYHPLKTWFIVEQDNRSVLGNITPRLQALHCLLPGLVKQDFTKVSSCFNQLLFHYFDIAKRLDKRLDEGLSNFGLDSHDNLYYLDDDIYAWDNFTSIASILAVWIRQLEDLDEEKSKILGECLAVNILETFQSSHAIQVLYGQLRQNFAVSERETRCLNLIMEHLWYTSRKLIKQSKNPNPQSKENATKTKGKTLGTGIRSITDTRFAVLADIHANLPALQAVLEDIDKANIQQILILGDIVGYGPHPTQCIDLLQARPCLIIQGNHDYAAATGDTQRGFSKLAKWAIDWTYESIDDVYKTWLAQLSPIYKQDNWMAVHGSPIDKQYFYAYVYHMTYQANLDWLVQHNTGIAFHGHSHIQMSYRRLNKVDNKVTELQQSLKNNLATLVCPGSVGQPRGGSRSAEYAIFDSTTQNLQLKRLDYDIQATISDMKQLNFPATLYERLIDGK